MDKKLVGVFMVALMALVFTVSLTYCTSTQSDQTSILSPTPTPEPTLISHSHFILIAGLALLIIVVVFVVFLFY